MKTYCHKPSARIKKAFTAIELVLVITLLAIFMGLALLYNQSTTVRTDLNTQVSLFVAELRLLQSNASSGKNPGDFGVHLDPNSYTLFEGDTYNVEDPLNRAILLPTTITIQNINLNGAGSEIIFSSPHGGTAQNGTLEFYSEPVDKITLITITSLGNVTY
ncbi:MAG: type II secretion system protein [Candidatus Gracilibacteria bacterium]